MNKTADSPFFSVSLSKLMIMSACTLTLYQYYWFYKNWCIIKRRENSRIMPGWRTTFVLIFCYSLFKKISAEAQTRGIEMPVPPILLAIGWAILSLLSGLEAPYSLLGLCSGLVLLPLQSAANKINLADNPQYIPNNRYSIWNIIAILLGGIVLILAIIGYLMPAA